MLNRLAVLCGSVAPYGCGVLDYSERLNAELSRRGVAVHALHEPVTFSGIAPMLGRLRDIQPDALLMQYPNVAYGHSLAPHLLANVARRVPFILTLHEFGPAHKLRKLSVGLLTRARAIIVTNEMDRSDLIRWYPWVASRVRMVPLASNIPGRPWQPVSPFTAAYFGLFRPGKGLEEFMECARIVRARSPDIRFLAIGALTGSAPEYGRAFLEQAKGMGVDVLVGASEQEVAAALSAASVAYLPFPDGATARRGSILAAASCGLPVISTTGPFTTPELTAALLMSGSPAEAAETILALRDDSARLQDAHQRSERLGRMFSWENTAERYVEVLDGGCALQRAPC